MIKSMMNLSLSLGMIAALTNTAIAQSTINNGVTTFDQTKNKVDLTLEQIQLKQIRLDSQQLNKALLLDFTELDEELSEKVFKASYFLTTLEYQVTTSPSAKLLRDTKLKLITLSTLLNETIHFDSSSLLKRDLNKSEKEFYALAGKLDSLSELQLNLIEEGNDILSPLDLILESLGDKELMKDLDLKPVKNLLCARIEFLIHHYLPTDEKSFNELTGDKKLDILNALSSAAEIYSYNNSDDKDGIQLSIDSALIFKLTRLKLSDSDDLQLKELKNLTNRLKSLKTKSFRRSGLKRI